MNKKNSVELVIESSALKIMNESEARLVVENAPAAGQISIASFLDMRRGDMWILQTLKQSTKST